jgi:hypothetical protein
MGSRNASYVYRTLLNWATLGHDGVGKGPKAGASAGARASASSVHLNRGLQESGLSAADYEILAVLSDHDGDRMPAQDMGNTLGWEKSVSPTRCGACRRTG